jgi:hypothetical protein
MRQAIEKSIARLAPDSADTRLQARENRAARAQASFGRQPGKTASESQKATLACCLLSYDTELGANHKHGTAQISKVIMADVRWQTTLKWLHKTFIIDERYEITNVLDDGDYGIIW